ncbi:hypothetical protein CAI21_06420 [Alkalilimnicola ehrlichii]|uniref:Coenzyme F420 hydrogenase n=2 Tax=Alkalilimnicola ehrlichii TaxID=351052 RepID=A0A3E0WYE3_9GAMM|nr:hypothetical protein CAI21_06420 [Alkalilimnicola ehrlichii]RFA37828.1 hypothetical protein CAL65_07770 [Alkalilimnicola ehrlichii]
MSQISERVLPGGYCIGCGACSYLDDAAYKLDWTSEGTYQATLQAGQHNPSELADQVCPFTNKIENEDEIGERLFGGFAEKARHVGYFRGCYVGHVEEEDHRSLGSSGGVGRWLLAELLKVGAVDYVIQVEPQDGSDTLFSYACFNDPAQVRAAAKSAYYPVTLAGALERIRSVPGRYAITAIPCFAKTLRNLAKVDSVIDERLSLVIGIICGHLKTASFAEALAWQLGVEPNRLKGIDFRGKIEGKKANDKGVTASDGTHLAGPISSKQLFGGNWGWNLFKYKACDYCDDVLAETADVAIGDAWLPEYVNDHRGSSVVVIRDPGVQRIVERANAAGRLDLTEVAPEVIVKSQMGGIRHRTEGLALRLSDDIAVGKWVPTKRVEPGVNLTRRRKRMYRARVALRDVSIKAYQEAKERRDFAHLERAVQPYIKQLDDRPVWRVVGGALYRYFLKTVKKA